MDDSRVDRERHWTDLPEFRLLHCPPGVRPLDSYYIDYPIPADVEAVYSGWEVTLAARKYGWVDQGIPDGFYASVFGTVGGVSVTMDERIPVLDFDPDTVDWALDAFVDEIDHTLDVKRWGFGVTLGYQMLAANGLGVDAYIGPMFRGITRTYDMPAIRGRRRAHRGTAPEQLLLPPRHEPGDLLRQHRPLVRGRHPCIHGVLTVLRSAARRAASRRALPFLASR